MHFLYFKQHNVDFCHIFMPTCVVYLYICRNNYIIKVKVNIMPKKEDLRVIKTKKNLFEGLLTMMKEKAFEDIKVSDICSAALTNRSTFYDHFNDKYELLDALIKELEEGLIKKLEENNGKGNTKEYYIKMIDLFFDHVSENMNAYIAILSKNNNSTLMDMVYDAITKDVLNNLENNTNANKVPLEIISKFYVSAVINVCLEYIKYPNKYKKEDIINYLDILLPNVIY